MSRSFGAVPYLSSRYLAAQLVGRFLVRPHAHFTRFLLIIGRVHMHANPSNLYVSCE